MRYFITHFLLLFFFFAKAQNPIFIEPGEDDADSLRAIVRNPLNDTLEMASCRGLALYFLDVNADSSKYFSNRDLQLARKLNLRLWEADALDLNAIALNRSGDYSRSLEYFLKAIQIASDPETEKSIWRINAFTQSFRPDYARKSVLATIYLDMGNLYQATNFHKEAASSYTKALALAAEIGDYTIPSIVYAGQADLYITQNKLDSAEICINLSLQYGDSANYTKYRNDGFFNYGNIELMRGNWDKAKDLFHEGLWWSIDQHNVMGQGELYVALANLYLEEGNLDSADYYARASLVANRGTYYKERILKSYNLLYQVHKSLNRSDSAFHYLEKAKALTDSINSDERIKQFQNIGFREQLKVKELEESEADYQNRLRTNALLGSSLTLIIIAIFLYRNNRSNKKAKQKIESAYDQLKSTQTQLIQSEKMASLGELTAGIAHEIQNPLNFVNNFSEVNDELLDDLKEAIANNDHEEITAIYNDLKDNESKIKHHGQRAEGIVKGMLQHSRTSQGEKEPTDINALANEYLRLAFHGMRAKDKSFNADFRTDFDPNLPKVKIVPQDMGRVILNLINNAFYVVDKKSKEQNQGYKPEVQVRTSKVDGSIQISVKDNGPGIPAEIKDKIFQPFFTTKPTGQGTGLGLSLSYDIVKAHSGDISVKSKDSKGSEFTVTFPIG